MANYLAYRDGGKTNEKGISQHLQGMFSGEVINGLQAQQNGTPNMSVNITKGRCMIDSGDDYPYLGFTDSSTTNVTVATADGSNPRIDTVVAYVDLSVVSSATSNNPNAFKLKTVSGTPAGSPVAPNSAAISSSIGAGNPYIKLANIAVGAGVTTITNGNITDTRVDTSAVLADSAVTPAKWTNPYCFRAYASGSTTLTDGSYVKVLFATENYDYNNNFTGSTYTAPVAGVYNFSSTVSQATVSATPAIIFLTLYVNGSAAARGVAFTPSTVGIPCVTYAGDVLLAANDTVEIYCYQDSAGNEATITGSELTFFSGHLVHKV